MKTVRDQRKLIFVCQLCRLLIIYWLLFMLTIFIEGANYLTFK